MTEQKDLFPKAHKALVLATLDSYEKELNEKMQKTLDTIEKKNEELVAIGDGLKSLRLARKYVDEEMAAEAEPFPVEVSIDSAATE